MATFKINKENLTIEAPNAVRSGKITFRMANAVKADEFVVIFSNILQAIGVVENATVLRSGYKYLTNWRNQEWDNSVGCEWTSDLPSITYNDDVRHTAALVFHYKLTQIQFNKFQELCDKELGLNVTPKSNKFWWPCRMLSLYENVEKMWVDDVKPKYPLYIISKGRWEKRLTSKYLEWAGLDYKIVVEPQEYDNYAAVISPAKILVLPEKYLNLNQGGIPARNFVLHHSRANGDHRHWILDDNISAYSRHTNNERLFVKGGSAFRTIEDFTDRYTNVKISGHQYLSFAPPSLLIRAFAKNTRVYSSILIRNDIEFEWRGKYNEDTDLSLRVLKSGSPTLLFSNFLAHKAETLSQKGGNTDSIYTGDGVKEKAEALLVNHPDVTTILSRFGKVHHHHVNYNSFKKLALVKKENPSDPPTSSGIEEGEMTPAEPYNLRLCLITDYPALIEGHNSKLNKAKETAKAEEAAKAAAEAPKPKKRVILKKKLVIQAEAEVMDEEAAELWGGKDWE